MRKNLLLFIVLCAWFAIPANAQLAHFPFDSDEKDANQEINSTATGTGVTYVNDAARGGNVMELDGTNGYITCPDNDVYSFDAVTYNIWFQWNHPAADQWWVRIFDFGIPSDLDPHPGNHDVVFLTTYQDGRLRWHIHSVDWTDGSDTILSSLEMISTNQWYMLTCTHDADSAKLYLNGVLQDARSVNSVKPSDLEFTNMYLGRSNWPDLLFLGRMDDFRVYNSVLTQEEINALYVVPDAIKNPELNDRIKIYSNDGILTVELQGTAGLNIYNMQGQLVQNRANFENTTEITGLTPGIYIVLVSIGSESLTRKIVID